MGTELLTSPFDSCRPVVLVMQAGRPAVIVQTDALPAEHASVVVCQMTSEGDDAEDFRVAVEPSTRNGLRTRSHVMADNPVTIRRARLGRKIGRLDDALRADVVER